MTQSVTEIARAAMTSYEALESFTATEIITAGSIRVEARVRYRKPGMITVESALRGPVDCVRGKLRRWRGVRRH